MAKDTKVRHIVLSMPQRLSIARATPEVLVGRRWSRLEAPTGLQPVTLVPSARLRGSPAAEVVDVNTLLPAGASITGQGRVVSADGTVPAAVITGLGRRDAHSLLRRADVDCAWHAADDRVIPIYRDRASAVASGHPDDPDALSEGATLRDVVQRISPGAPSPDVPWTSAPQAGWVAGGRLGIKCEKCPEPLLWCDWWHLKALRSRNSWYAFCPAHGGPIKQTHTRGLLKLVEARRQLDSATWARSSGGEYQCYVFDVNGLGSNQVYVGQTSKSVECRIAQHERGYLPAQILKRPGASRGELRQGLLGDLPVLSGKDHALAAEQWVATRLTYLGYKVHGGH